MLRRLLRIIRSWLGWGVSLGESPELILQQNIRDLEAEVPKLNEQLSLIAAQKLTADRELQKLREQESGLVNKTKAALKASRRDIAQQYALELEKLKPQLAEKERAATNAGEAFKKANSAKKIFLSEKDKKIQEAKSALDHKRQAEWNDRLANTLANFQVASVDQTHSEMIAKIEEDNARSEAKLQMALNDKQSPLADLEEDAQKIQADEVLRQFETDMGLAAPAENASEASREKTMGPVRERV